MGMRQARLDGDPGIEVELRRSARARRLSLRVSRLDGRVTLTLPAWLPQREALAFLRDREEWIREALNDHVAPRPVRTGDSILFEGRPVMVTAGRTPAAVISDDRLILPERRLAGAGPGPAIAAFLRLAARDRLLPACDRHASRLGLDFGRVTLRDTRSRWGSCSPEGNLMFSWRLVMAPPDVLDYVAAHEVAHRAEMNHSPRFWAHVARLCPDHARHRAWLRQHGHGLHRYRFDPLND